MDEIVALCKRRGFVFPTSEIYGGLGSTYDYGHYGVLLRNNVKGRGRAGPLRGQRQRRDRRAAIGSVPAEVRQFVPGRPDDRHLLPGRQQRQCDEGALCHHRQARSSLATSPRECSRGPRRAPHRSPHVARASDQRVEALSRHPPPPGARTSNEACADIPVIRGEGHTCRSPRGAFR